MVLLIKFHKFIVVNSIDKTILFITLFFISIIPVHSQTISIKGSILNIETSEPIAYASIYSEENQFLSFCNSKGEFYIEIPSIHQYITVKSLGYEDQKISVNEDDSGGFLKIHLIPKTYYMDELVIESRVSKKIVIGDTILQGRIKSLSFGSVPYASIAIPFKFQEYPASIQNFSFYIESNHIGNFDFRLRLLTKGKRGKPGTDILNQNLIHHSNQQKGWVNIECKDINFVVSEKNIYLVIEIIQDKDRNKNPIYEAFSTPGFGYSENQKEKIYIATKPNTWNLSKKLNIIANIRYFHLE